MEGRLVAKEAVKRRLVPRVGRKNIRLHGDLKPWPEKMRCIPELNEVYITKMEDVLETYEQPYDLFAKNASGTKTHVSTSMASGSREPGKPEARAM